jgi:thymidylate synthase (FAD)
VQGDEKLLAFLYNNRHATPFEMAGLVIEVQAPIMVFREWHRHRTQSYNEMSARYVPLPDVNYMPMVERCMIVSATNKQAGSVKGADELTHEGVLAWLEELAEVYRHAERVYQSGLAKGIPKEIARLPVPVGRYSRMRAQATLRNWLAFLTLRSDHVLSGKAAQFEIRQFANEVSNIIQQTFPRTHALFVGT